MQRQARAPAPLSLNRPAPSLARTIIRLAHRLLPGLSLAALLAGALSSCLALPPALADPEQVALPASRTPTSNAGELLPGSTPTKRSSGASLPVITPDPARFRPSATPSPGAGLPTPTPSATPRPLRISMLLYLDSERLARWNALTDQTTSITDNVAAYSPSANGRFVALLKRDPGHPGSATAFSLWRMDLTNFDLVELLPRTPWLDHLSISPDGQWVAHGGSAGEKTIRVHPAARPGSQVSAGDCEAEDPEVCQGLSWSPNSQEFFWVDGRGIWLFNLYRTGPTLASPAQIEVADPKGKKSIVKVNYHEPSWSPLGRYVLAKVEVEGSQVHWFAILDMRNGRMANIPGTYEMSSERVSAGWGKTGELFIANGGEAARNIPPFIQRWEIVPTRDELVALADEIELPLEDFPTRTDTQLAKLDYALAWIHSFDERFLSFTAILPRTNNEAVLFLLDLKTRMLKKLAGLPYDTEQVLWSPDMNGAIILGRHGQALYCPMDAKELRDLHTVLGENLGFFSWQPLLPVPP